MTATLPPLPTKTGGPSNTHKHYALYQRVLAAIHALPNHFHTVLNIEGVAATDLFTLNTALGASIEQSMVDCLNDLRELWDPKDEYPLYRFVRQSQTFPDVRLQTDEPTAEKIIFGIELKGWFTLAKEGEPSFRYKVTPEACAEMDLLVVVPWVFNNVISGTPVLLKPIITEARFAAQMRNYHWEHLRATRASRDKAGIIMAGHKTPYPDKASKSSDEAISDSGSNFGRIARSRIFDDDVDEVLQKTAGGIPLQSWHYFLSLFREKATGQSIYDDLMRLKSSLETRYHLSPEQETQLLDAFVQIAKAFEAAPGPEIKSSSLRPKR